jgi:hypothetical protein
VTRKLLVTNGRSEREIVLAGNITIGRDPACHVSEDDPLLSRHHAEIIANVHGVSVRDLDSRNGLLVNGEKTREQVLLHGDIVQMGHLQLRYIEEQVRPADGRQTRGREARRHEPALPPQQPASQPYDFDRFRPEPTPTPTPRATRRTRQPPRWKPEPTPLPGQRPAAPAPPARVEAPAPRGRAAFDDTVTVPRHTLMEPIDHTGVPPSSPQANAAGKGGSHMDATIIAATPPGALMGDGPGQKQNDTVFDEGRTSSSPDSTMTPGSATFAAALAHLANIARPTNERLPHPNPGAHLMANAELTVTDASKGCAELLGIPDEDLVGDSLTDVFVRAVRRAYAQPACSLGLSIARGSRGSITVTFTLNKDRGTE